MNGSTPYPFKGVYRKNPYNSIGGIDLGRTDNTFHTFDIVNISCQETNIIISDPEGSTGNYYDLYTIIIYPAIYGDVTIS